MSSNFKIINLNKLTEKDENLQILLPNGERSPKFLMLKDFFRVLNQLLKEHNLNNIIPGIKVVEGSNKIPLSTFLKVKAFESPIIYKEERTGSKYSHRIKYFPDHITHWSDTFSLDINIDLDDQSNEINFQQSSGGVIYDEFSLEAIMKAKVKMLQYLTAIHMTEEWKDSKL